MGVWKITSITAHLFVFVCVFMYNSYCIVPCLGGITAVLFRQHRASRARYKGSRVSTFTPSSLVEAAQASISLKLMCCTWIYQKTFCDIFIYLFILGVGGYITSAFCLASGLVNPKYLWRKRRRREINGSLPKALAAISLLDWGPTGHHSH